MGLESLVIIGIVLAAGAMAAGVAVLVVARRTQRLLRAMSPETIADSRHEERRAFATLLLRYSELLGVEVVTGRIPNRGDTSASMRGRLELALKAITEPGSAELFDEVGTARDELPGLEPRRRAALNGLIAMDVEWSIERWVAHPLTWLADTREQHRLSRIAQASPVDRRLAAAS